MRDAEGRPYDKPPYHALMQISRKMKLQLPKGISQWARDLVAPPVVASRQPCSVINGAECLPQLEVQVAAGPRFALGWRESAANAEEARGEQADRSVLRKHLLIVPATAG